MVVLRKPKNNLLPESKMRRTERIRSWAQCAQALILELHSKSPNHSTFSQVGILNGIDTVEDFLKYGEDGCAVHHLLYMIHESDIKYPAEDVLELHALAEKLGERNFYTRENQETLPEEYRCKAYNIPEK